ncbi:hypothetical protein [Halioglobus sp. Uisw_031]|uniref:hypothetical protein n=1 Tax=Halioglobus sp. Uisw_031 TaxID=3230977 RepID=UPI0039EB8E93
MTTKGVVDRNILTYTIAVIALLTFTAGTFFFLLNIDMWVRYHINIPSNDAILQIPLIASALEHGIWSTNLQDWFSIHAGAHRIALIRTLMFVDYRFFAGYGYVSYAVAWLSIALILVVYTRAFRQTYRSETALLIFSTGLALLFLSSHTQFVNLIQIVNTTWYMALGASALAIHMITKTSAPPSFFVFSVAYVLAIIAGLANFGGVIVWLLLPLVIAMRSISIGLLGGLCSGVLLALYLPGIGSNEASLANHPIFIDTLATALKNSPLPVETLTALDFQPPTLLEQLKNQVVYMFSQTYIGLGSPASQHHPLVANIAVSASLLLIICGWLKVLISKFFDRYRHNAWFELALVMATLCLGIVLSTYLEPNFFRGPLLERYQTIVMVYWLSVCNMLLGFAWAVNRNKPLWRLISTLCCVGITAFLLANPDHLVHNQSAHANRLMTERMSVLSPLGIPDADVYQPLLSFGQKRGMSGTQLNKFLSRRHQVRHVANTKRLSGFQVSRDCPDVDLKVKPSRWPGISMATGHIDNNSAVRHRQIPISNDQGSIIGYMFPANRTDLVSMLVRRKVSWEGYFIDSEDQDIVYLHYGSSLFTRASCRIKTDRWIDPIACNTAIAFSDDGADRYFGARGLSGHGPHGRWSNGSVVELSLLPEQGCHPDTLQLDLSPYLKREHPQQTADIFVNENLVEEISLSYGMDNPKEFLIQLPEFVSGKIKVRFEIKKPMSPHALGLSEDKRALGFLFRGIKLVSPKVDPAVL